MPKRRANTIRRGDIARIVARTKAAKEFELSGFDVDSLLDEAYKAIRQNIVEGKNVEIDDVGVFKTKMTPGRFTYNPSSKRKSYVNEHEVVRFYPGATLRRDIRHSDKKK